MTEAEQVDSLFAIGVCCLLLGAGIGCRYGTGMGKDLARQYHCSSLGFEAFEVSDRGTVTCIDVIRKKVVP